MRWLRGLGSLAVLGLVLVGAPLALVAWGRVPPGLAGLARPDDGSLLLAALTVAGWLAWAAFAFATLVEAVRLGDREHRGPRLPLLGGLQQLSAGLLVAVLALAPAAATTRAPAPSPAAAAAPEPVPQDEPTAAAPTAVPSDTYLVEPGDDLWTLSAQLLGDGGRWRELVAVNPDLLRDPTDRLTPGTRLALPACAGRVPRTVTVRRGDTLSGLALEHLGAAARWPRIAAANPELVTDPDHIEVGWQLVIPGAAAPAHRVSREHEEKADSADDTDRTDRPAPGALPEGSRWHDPAPTGAGTETDPGTEIDAGPEIDASRAGPLEGAGPPAGAPESAEAAASDGTTADLAPGLPLLGGFGTLAAAAIIGVVETRRLLRLRERPVGRRLIRPEESAAQLRVALGVRQRPDRLAALDAALRVVGSHCHAAGVPLPELERVVVSSDRVRLEWADAAGPPPPGFTGAAGHWEVSLASPPDPSDHPCPYPAVVSLGSTADGDLILVDAERSRVLGVATDDTELARSALAAMGVELACAPWSDSAHLIAVGADAGLLALAGGERVDVLGALPDALERLRAQVARRRAALGAEPLASLRVDPDRADAVAPVVFCLLDDVPAALAEELDGLLAGPGTGVVVLLATPAAAEARWQVGGDVYEPSGRLAGVDEPLRAHAIGESMRAGVSRLFAADTGATTVAPWWREPAPVDDNVLALPPRVVREGDPVDIVRLAQATEHPQVLLIGPAELRGAAGPAPARSRQQLVELCAWLLEHPGSTGTAMAAGLMVAESTRRSNLSRLRAWLGTAPDGSAYLPDAYSGRVLLHPGVASDWHRLQVLLAPGANRVGDSTLVAALDLVRGAPLADAAPTQWHWAEELRTDVTCALRDVGVVLADRALERGDVDLARWAASRALVVAPEDEQLLCARIRTELRASNTAEVERLVNHVTRQARILGVDLLPETIRLCQQALEGRVRARA